MDTDILINVLLDRSGSMAGKESDVIGHYNKYIEEQRNLPGTATVSLVLFDDRYEEVYIGKNIHTVQPLDGKTYYTRGSTAYLDALGRLIKAVDALPNKPAKVIFVINTDGIENASKEYNIQRIREMVEERQNNHDWQFAFIGVGLDATSVGAASSGIGIRGFSTYASASVGDSYGSLSSSTIDYRTNVSSTLNVADAGAEIDKKKKPATNAGSR